MEAEDARCHLLYGKERVTIAREGGLMLTEERDVRREGCETITVPPSPEICEKRVNEGNPNPLELLIFNGAVATKERATTARESWFMLTEE